MTMPIRGNELETNRFSLLLLGNFDSSEIVSFQQKRIFIQQLKWTCPMQKHKTQAIKLTAIFSRDQQHTSTIKCKHQITQVEQPKFKEGLNIISQPTYNRCIPWALIIKRPTSKMTFLSNFLVTSQIIACFFQ